MMFTQMALRNINITYVTTIHEKRGHKFERARRNKWEYLEEEQGRGNDVTIL